MSEQTFDPNQVDYSGVEPSQDLEYRQFKPGTFELQIDAVNMLVDDQNRPNVRFRMSLVEGQSCELISQEGDEMLDPKILKAGSIFERFWFHKKEALPIFAKFLERLGLRWTDYTASTDKKAFLESLKGAKFHALVSYNEEYKKNEIKRVLKASA